MDLSSISMRYAKALYAFATELKEENSVYAEMQALAKALMALPKLEQMLHNPVVPATGKKQLIVTAASGEKTPTKALTRFIDLLISKKRTPLMLLIAYAYASHYRKQKHITEGRLTLPAEADTAQQERMRKILEKRAGGNVSFKVDIRPEILGGFVLEYDTYRLDASLRTQLAQLRRRL